MNDFIGNNETPSISYDPAESSQNYIENKIEDYVDFLKSRNFLYSNGTFNEFCFLYSFKDKKDIQNNYFNTLFLVLPPCEYDAMSKFKNLIKSIKNEILMEDNPTISNAQIYDSFIKFKQEIQSNHEQSVKLMRKENNRVNFNDSVQFLHIKSGKFLSFKKHDQHLKTYVELTEKMSKNTIFRFTPAFKYQAENSTNVYFNLTIQIACGEKNTRNEKYISNIKSYKFQDNINININANTENKAVLFGKQLLKRESKKREKSLSLVVNERNKSIRMSLKNIFPDINPKSKLKENFLTYSTNSNFAYKNFGKKLLPEDNYIGIDIKSKDYWRLILFSQNYIKDNKYINLLDYFCIQNIEKNLFIQSIDSNKLSEDKDLNDKYIEKKKEIKNRNLIKDIQDIQNSQLISEKLIDEKEKIPKIPIQSINNFNISNEESKNNSFLNHNNEELNYYVFDETFYSNLKCELKIDFYNEKDFLDPFGLFKFEIINNNKNINKDLKTDLKILSEKCFVRIINVFTNKVISVDRKNYQLKLIDNIDLSDKLYDSTLFKIEQSNETQEAYIQQGNMLIKDNNNEEKNKIINNDDNFERDNVLLKNDYIKIKTRKGGLYIGIRLNNNNSKELVLTKSMSDLIRFKLNFLDEEDKYELHFFEQLLMSLKKILEFFEKEKENDDIDENNYEHIQHILITLESKIIIFKNNRNVKIVQENKFDFLKIIKNFNIVSKLIDLFISNWFHDYKNLDYNKFDSILSKYFKETKKKDELKCKQIISKKILKILTIIYDLDKSYLDPISNRLLYFFMFVGRDDKCTKFLVHILKNNRKF